MHLAAAQAWSMTLPVRYLRRTNLPSSNSTAPHFLLTSESAARRSSPTACRWALDCAPIAVRNCRQPARSLSTSKGSDSACRRASLAMRWNALRRAAKRQRICPSMRVFLLRRLLYSTRMSSHPPLRAKCLSAACMAALCLASSRALSLTVCSISKVWACSEARRPAAFARSVRMLSNCACSSEEPKPVTSVTSVASVRCSSNRVTSPSSASIAPSRRDLALRCICAREGVSDHWGLICVSICGRGVLVSVCGCGVLGAVCALGPKLASSCCKMFCMAQFCLSKDSSCSRNLESAACFPGDRTCPWHLGV
mmetsp:Transcript_12694/g.28518  ORF Transcript_12694/g.28518 Transcript_12694/m.28518 type:complete len:310 (+) Transcript_12694:270-1199(+)